METTRMVETATLPLSFAHTRLVEEKKVEERKAEETNNPSTSVAYQTSVAMFIEFAKQLLPTAEMNSHAILLATLSLPVLNRKIFDQCMKYVPDGYHLNIALELAVSHKHYEAAADLVYRGARPLIDTNFFVSRIISHGPSTSKLFQALSNCRLQIDYQYAMQCAVSSNNTTILMDCVATKKITMGEIISFALKLGRIDVCEHFIKCVHIPGVVWITIGKTMMDPKGRLGYADRLRLMKAIKDRNDNVDPKKHIVPLEAVIEAATVYNDTETMERACKAEICTWETVLRVAARTNAYKFLSKLYYFKPEGLEWPVDVLRKLLDRALAIQSPKKSPSRSLLENDELPALELDDGCCEDCSS